MTYTEQLVKLLEPYRDKTLSFGCEIEAAAQQEKEELVREILEVIPNTVPYVTGDQNTILSEVKAIAQARGISVSDK